MQEYIVKASPEDAGKRLDIFITEFTKRNDLGLSRTSVKALIEKGGLIRKNAVTPNSHYKVKEEDEFTLRIEHKAPCALQAENILLEIVFTDPDLAVINKQAGLVVHPAPGNSEHTLVNALLYHFGELSDVNPLRPGIVHRLDKDTSGLLVVAKNNPAHQNLAQQFAAHSIKRKYVALVQGSVEFDEHCIEMPIGRHPHKRKNMAVGFGKNTKNALTRYRVLKRGNGFTFVELEPFTGRTHQLRVHLAYLGNPILGDAKYGKNNEFGRLALHAQYIGFVHPRTQKFIEFSSEIPKEFKDFLDAEL